MKKVRVDTGPRMFEVFRCLLDLVLSDLVLNVHDSIGLDPSFENAFWVFERMVLSVMLGHLHHDGILEASGLLGTEGLASIREAGRRGEMHEAAGYVKDTLIDSLTVSGTPTKCVDRLEDYREAGITLPVIVPIARVGRPEQIKKAIAYAACS